MWTAPPALASALAGSETTICRLYALLRRDGFALRVTDHDRDLSIDGVTWTASGSLDASEATAELGLAVGGGEVTGALSAEAMTEADLAAGLWDGARLEVRLCDWSRPLETPLVEAGELGEVRRRDGAFTAELRSLAHHLSAERGRIVSRRCDATLGDPRCGVDLGRDGRRVAGPLGAVLDARRVRMPALDAAEPGAFSEGHLALGDGSLELSIAAHERDAAGAVLTLAFAPPRPFAAGEAAVATRGCDGRFETCRDRFGNSKSFRGFPHVPGLDRLARVAGAGSEPFDGGSLNR